MVILRPTNHPSGGGVPRTWEVVRLVVNGRKPSKIRKPTPCSSCDADVPVH